VPVEEPSTASIGDIEDLFDHLVGARKQLSGNFETERLGSL
jgi:hypothetical protein